MNSKKQEKIIERLDRIVSVYVEVDKDFREDNKKINQCFKKWMYQVSNHLNENKLEKESVKRGKTEKKIHQIMQIIKKFNLIKVPS